MSDPIRLSRRQAVIGASVTALSACAPNMPATGEAAMTEVDRSEGGSGPQAIVLVHGAWHGGWCWDLVRPLLEASGHRVHSPSLPGLADRSHELDGSIGLQTHINAVTDLIVSEDLQRIILVGHSYGGMVVTGVTDRLKGRVNHVIYLDAAVPQDGQSMISYGPQRSAQEIEATRSALQALSPDGIAMAPPPPEAFGIPPGHEHLSWVAENLTPHPLKTWLDPIALENGGSDELGRTYVHCTDPVLPMTAFPYIAQQAGSDESWSLRLLETGHDAMITAPQEVADLILEVTEGR